MTRYLIDIYKVEIPENGQRRDDLTEATEDWLGKHGRDKCYQFQMQGNSLKEIGERLTKDGDSSVLALSIRQPWAWLIIHAGKDIENRSWPTRFRGRVLIHASKGMTEQEYRDACNFMATDSRLAAALKALPQMHELQRGGIIGEVEVAGCVTDSESPWFVGKYGFVLRNPKPLPFRGCCGALGFFNPTQSSPMPGL